MPVKKNAKKVVKTKKVVKKVVKKAVPKVAAKKVVKQAAAKAATKATKTTKPAQAAAKKVVKKTLKKAATKPVTKTNAKATAATKPGAKRVVKAAPSATIKASAAIKPSLKGAAVRKTLVPASGAKRVATTAKATGKAVARAPEPVLITVALEDAGARIDRYLGEKLENASRTRIQKWMNEDAVHVNGEPVRKSRTLEPGDLIQVTKPVEIPRGHVEPEDIPLEIVYEDKYLVVVNKPKGLVTHPGHGVPGGTLANALLYHYKTLSNFGGTDRPGIVHRLDRDTSGLLVAARDNVTHAALSTMLAERKIHRTYQALVWREASPAGTFEAPLGRHPRDPVKRAVIAPTYRGTPGKPAVTHYKVLDWYQFASHVEVSLDTGRTHQIRVHFAHAGHPVAGDVLYGGGESMLGRVPPLFQASAAALLKRLSSQALHATNLSFVHPRTKKKLSFQSPLPAEFRESLKFLEKFKRDVVVEDVQTPDEEDF